MEDSSIGLAKGVVRLLPYHPEWAALFLIEKRALLAAIGPYILDIQHVGSTAIPGMLSKPIIDIAIAVQDFEAARVTIAPIVALGYEFKGELGIPRRHYFSKGEPTTFHIHMNEVTSQDWLDQILFRDTMIAHPDLVIEYARLKVQLAEQFPNDRPAYTDGKTVFIQGVLQQARSWMRVN